MSLATRSRNLLLEQAVEAIVPVLSSYGGGAVGAHPDIEGAIDRATSVFADRIVSRWQDWLRPRSPGEVLQLLSALTSLSVEDARQDAAGVLDRHLLDVRPEDRSFALDYVASIPGQIKQVLVFDRAGGTYHLPPGWSSTSPDALRRFLPMSEEMKSTWARSRPKSPDTPQMQTQPDALRTVLAVHEVTPALPPPAPLVRHSQLAPKLRVLLRAHWLVLWAWCRRLALTLVLLFVCAILGGLAGAGVFWTFYSDPHQHAQKYERWVQNAPGLWPQQIMETTYYVHNEKVTQQQYDYYLRTNSNMEKVMIAAVPSGIGAGALLFGLGVWLLWRWPTASQRILNDQIQTIVTTNPDEVKNWGGVAVLRQRGLVAEILRLEEKGMG